MSLQLPRSRRRVGFTREGWYFIFILAFIIFGSVLRQINLLIVLAGMMAAALLFSWRIAIAIIRKISAQHRHSDWLFAGESTVIEVELENQSTALIAWNVYLEDQIRQVMGPKQPLARQTVELVAPRTNTRQSSFISYRCLFCERGVYELGPTRLSCRFPFGLVDAWVKIHNISELRVAPALGELHPKWHKRLGSVAIGTASVERKRGMLHDEYYGIRNWSAGDSRRWVHWRSTAKRGELMVKQFDQPTDRDFALALDLRISARPTDGELQAVEDALSFTATILSQLNYAVHGRVAIAICGEESFLYVNQLAGDFIRSVMHQLASARPATRTDLSYQIPELAANVAMGTPLIVVTTRPAQEVESLRRLWRADDAERVAESNIQWIHVPSTEFDSMFRPAQAIDVTEMPLDNKAIVAEQLEVF